MKEKIEYAANVRSAENRSAELIPTEIREAVEKANEKPIEKRDGRRVLQYRRP